MVTRPARAPYKYCNYYIHVFFFLFFFFFFCGVRLSKYMEITISLTSKFLFFWFVKDVLLLNQWGFLVVVFCISFFKFKFKFLAEVRLGSVVVEQSTL